MADDTEEFFQAFLLTMTVFSHFVHRGSHRVKIILQLVEHFCEEIMMMMKMILMMITMIMMITMMMMMIAMTMTMMMMMMIPNHDDDDNNDDYDDDDYDNDDDDVDDDYYYCFQLSKLPTTWFSVKMTPIQQWLLLALCWLFLVLVV